MFVLFNVDSGKAVRIVRHGAWADAVFATEAAAKACATRLAKAGKLHLPDHCVDDIASWRAAHPVKMVERVNLMSGQKFMEAEDTPYFCSPSSETYWSM